MTGDELLRQLQRDLNDDELLVVGKAHVFFTALFLAALKQKMTAGAKLRMFAPRGALGGFELGVGQRTIAFEFDLAHTRVDVRRVGFSPLELSSWTREIEPPAMEDAAPIADGVLQFELGVLKRGRL